MIGRVDAAGLSCGQGTERVAVMYLGKLVEVARTSELSGRTRYPYTEALMSAISLLDPHLRASCDWIVLEGEMPSPRGAPPGCPFSSPVPVCRGQMS